MSLEEFDDISCCPECGEEVPDEKIYSCEYCGEIMCSNCLEEHEEKEHCLIRRDLFKW